MSVAFTRIPIVSFIPYVASGEVNRIQFMGTIVSKPCTVENWAHGRI